MQTEETLIAHEEVREALFSFFTLIYLLRNGRESKSERGRDEERERDWFVLQIS